MGNGELTNEIEVWAFPFRKAWYNLRKSSGKLEIISGKAWTTSGKLEKQKLLG